MRFLIPGLVVALAAIGCASQAPAPSLPSSAPAPSAAASAPPATAAERKTAAAEGLAVEHQWLQQWFRGTPVLIAQRNGALTVDVPREFCFAPGKSEIKPALAAVLDKVALSLRRLPLAQVQFLAAPDDANTVTPLTLQRAGQIRDYLRSRGVAAPRLATPSASTVPAVQLRIENAVS